MSDINMKKDYGAIQNVNDTQKIWLKNDLLTRFELEYRELENVNWNLKLIKNVWWKSKIFFRTVHHFLHFISNDMMDEDKNEPPNFEPVM